MGINRSDIKGYIEVSGSRRLREDINYTILMFILYSALQHDIPYLNILALTPCLSAGDERNYMRLDCCW